MKRLLTLKDEKKPYTNRKGEARNSDTRAAASYSTLRALTTNTRHGPQALHSLGLSSCVPVVGSQR